MLINDKSVFIKIIDTFLDTTPRQWLFKSKALLTSPAQIDWSNLVTNVIAKSKASSAYSIYSSLAIHGLLTILLIVSSGPQSIFANQEEKESIRLSTQKIKSQSPSSQQKQELVEITGIYYMSPEDLYPSKKKKRKVIKKTKLASLLDQMKASSPTNRNNIDRGSQSNFEVKVDNDHIRNGDTLAKAHKGSENEWQKELGLDQKTLQISNLEEELNQYLASYNPKFKNCYEKILLTDSSLNAKIEFTLKVGKQRNIAGSEIKFEGVGKPESKQKLMNCLQAVTKNIRLPEKSKNLKGKKLKFYVVLNSWN